MRPRLLAGGLALWLAGAGLSCRGRDAVAPAWQHARSWQSVAYCVDLGPASGDAPLRARVVAALERHLASLDGSVAVSVFVWEEDGRWQWQGSASKGSRLQTEMELSREETFSGFYSSVRDALGFLNDRWSPEQVGMVYLRPLAAEQEPSHEITEGEKAQLFSIIARNWARIPVDTVGVCWNGRTGGSSYLERLASSNQGSCRRLRL